MDRATGIVLNGNKIMFMQQVVNEKLCHVFVGGGIEKNETPEQAVLRELKEEANVEGSILYGPAIRTPDYFEKEYIFILKININQTPILGYDPEIPKSDEQVLKGIVWRDTDNDYQKFTETDKDYIKIIITHAEKQNIQAEWLKSLKKVLLERN
jgi:8-oxo-dGTP pyrophosphatase MutT (NUDIX family)